MLADDCSSIINEFEGSGRRAGTTARWKFLAGSLVVYAVRGPSTAVVLRAWALRTILAQDDNLVGAGLPHHKVKGAPRCAWLDGRGPRPHTSRAADDRV